MLELAREVALEVRGPDTARALLPPGRGRGSSVSSIVCYLTGLSHVDPIANDLFLGRFLNDELTALPDIDLDFPRDVRAALIPRIHERYGKDRSALVAAFPTYRARGAIRELGKALGLPPGEIERVARGSEGWSARDVAHDVAVRARRAAPRASGRWAWLARLAEQAHGLPRHLSQHPGGMVVATRPLVDCCPIVPAAMEGRQMVQWDKDSCADAGFLKIDLLGLGMLSRRRARGRGHRAAPRRAHRPVPHPLRRPADYDAIQRAETIGVFQIESRAQMASLLRTRPRTLQDITIQVAIVRPGPIQGGAVNPYIERLQRLRADPDFEVPYEHPSLVEPLRETLGTIIFQDQVIEVAMAFAGFSRGRGGGAAPRDEPQALGGGDRGAPRDVRRGRDRDARRGAGSWPSGSSRWCAASPASASRRRTGPPSGCSPTSRRGCASTTPPEFLCALLNEQPMGFYPPDALVHEAQRRGLTILPPDVNASEVECTVEAWTDGPADRRPCASASATCAGCSGPTREALVAARTAGGPFRDLGDLAARAGAGRPRSSCSRGRAPATSSPAATAASRCGGWGSRRRDAASPQGTQLALGLELPARARACSGSAPGTSCSPTTTRPASPPARTRSRSCAATLPQRRRRQPRPAADRARRARAGGRDGRRAPAPRHRQRRRLHAAGGRARDDQPDRPAEALRAQPPDRPHRAARARGRPARAPPGGRGRHQRARRADRAARRAERTLADVRELTPAGQPRGWRRRGRRLPRRRAGRHELRAGPAALSPPARRFALPFRGPLRVGSAAPMLATVAFLAFWVVVGLVLFFIALRGGPRGARATLQSQSRGGRRTAIGRCSPSSTSRSASPCRC